jgi:hypothetical protein
LDAPLDPWMPSHGGATGSIAVPPTKESKTYQYRASGPKFTKSPVLHCVPLSILRLPKFVQQSGHFDRCLHGEALPGWRRDKTAPKQQSGTRRRSHSGCSQGCGVVAYGSTCQPVVDRDNHRLHTMRETSTAAQMPAVALAPGLTMPSTGPHRPIGRFV